jgi:hypothetical protein
MCTWLYSIGPMYATSYIVGPMPTIAYFMWPMYARQDSMHARQYSIGPMCVCPYRIGPMYGQTLIGPMYVTACRKDPMRDMAYIVCRVYDREHRIGRRRARQGNAAFFGPTRTCGRCARAHGIDAYVRMNIHGIHNFSYNPDIIHNTRVQIKCRHWQ